MAKGGRYFDDGKGSVRRADTTLDEHHEYPAGEIAKDKDGKPLHPVSVEGAQGDDDADAQPAAPEAKKGT